MDLYNDKNHETFTIFSKFIILVPVVILLFALVTKMTNPAFLENHTQKAKIATMTPSVTMSPTPQDDEADLDAIAININGPQECIIRTKEASVSAYIKNKHIYMTIDKPNDSSRYLLSDGCLYGWKVGISAGEKQCNVDSYMSVLEYMSKFHLLTLGTITSLAHSAGVQETPNNKIQHAACAMNEVDDGKFAVPSTVRFVLKAAPTPSR